MSAPWLFTTASGATVLPSDFDILLPLASSVKPWVRTPQIGRAADGAAGLEHRGVEPAAMLVRAFEVEVRDAVRRSVGPSRSTKAWVEPLSNQTSRMSKTCS